jgi:hypothetical protein
MPQEQTVKKGKGLLAAIILFASFVASAQVRATDLTEQENLNVYAMMGALNVKELNADVRWLNGIGSVKTVLNLYVKGNYGNGFLDETELPPILSNLQADLQMTDLNGTLRSAGIAVENQVQRPAYGFHRHHIVHGAGLANHGQYIVSVVQIPSPQSKKVYLILAQAFRYLRTAQTFSASSPVLVWESKPWVVSNGDDASDAAEIREKVRNVTTRFASLCVGAE